VVVFAKEPGDYVEVGDVVAEVVNPLAEARKDRLIRLTAGTAGVLFQRITDRYARPGRTLAKIAGKTPLREEGGRLLEL